MNKIYKNPPIVEAIFELHFVCKDWKINAPFVIYEKVKDILPNISEQNQGAKIHFNDKGLISVEQNEQKLIRYSNSQNDSFVHFSQNMLAIHKTNNYSWLSFKELIIKMISSVEEQIKIDNIERLSLRMINKVNLIDNTIKSFKDNFTLYPTTTNETWYALQVHIENEIKDKNFNIVAINSAYPEPDYPIPIMVNFQYVKLGQLNYSYETWLEEAHNCLKEDFNTIFTEECKQKFD